MLSPYRCLPLPRPPSPFSPSLTSTVSQFTLHAVYKGSKASFHRAMPGTESEAMFYGLAAELKRQYSPSAVKECVFGSMMNVSLVNVGPVTLIIDSKQPKGG